MIFLHYGPFIWNRISARTGVFFLLSIIFPVFRIECFFLEASFCFLFVSRIFDRTCYFFFLKVIIVLLASISCIRYHCLELASKSFHHVLEMGNQCSCVRRVWKDVIADHKIVFCPDLHVVARLELTVEHVVFLHSHESCVFICL